MPPSAIAEPLEGDLRVIAALVFSAVRGRPIAIGYAVASGISSSSATCSGGFDSVEVVTTPDAALPAAATRKSSSTSSPHVNVAAASFHPSSFSRPSNERFRETIGMAPIGDGFVITKADILKMNRPESPLRLKVFCPIERALLARFVSEANARLTQLDAKDPEVTQNGSYLLTKPEHDHAE